MIYITIIVYNNNNNNKYLYSALSCVIQSTITQNECNTVWKRKMIEFESDYSEKEKHTTLYNAKI